MAFDTFISYASKDKPAADAACAVLERAGIRCWIAPRDIKPGGEYGGAIIEAIDQCRVMVLIFSSSANDSRQVHREIERAVSKGVPIIPVRIEEVTPTRSMEYFLGAIHWLDALTSPLENHLERLADAVKALLQINLAADAAPNQGTTPRAAASQAVERATAPRRDGGAIRLLQSRRVLIAALGVLCLALLIAGVWLYQVPAPTPAQALNSTRSVESGVDSVIANERSWDGNCAARPVAVKITKNPAHGTVSVAQGVTTNIPESTPAGGSTGACGGKTVTGSQIRYKSNAGFGGTDSVSYDVTFGDGPAQSRVISLKIALGVSDVVAPPSPFAQASVKAIFEKHNLLGSFAVDCSKPATKANPYFVNRLIDADHVQRDQMSAATTREFAIIIDKISESKPNELAWSGTREGNVQDGVWRIERNGNSIRTQGIEASWGGKQQISGGKWASDGREVPWLNKCGA
jgi:TIR domain